MGRGDFSSMFEFQIQQIQQHSINRESYKSGGERGEVDTMKNVELGLVYWVYTLWRVEN